jgi:hypothetical protein
MKECSGARHAVLRRGIVGAAQSEAIYQFKVALIGITPPIWRRVQVTGDYTLAKLHRVLQVVMGWENYHLYMFRIGSKKYGPPDPDGVDLGLFDAKRIRLAAVVPSVSMTFTYVYDYGDGWEHELLLEATLTPEPAMTYPCCLAGERRCPPEDVGGIGGYGHYLEAMFDPNHAEHEERMMWRGPFDAEEFLVAKVNWELAKKFRSRPKAAPRSITSTPELSTNANRLTETFIRPIRPQRQRIAIKADATVPLELNKRERDLIISHTFADESITNRLRVAPQPEQRPVFHFTLNELDELTGDVAAEANHAKSRVLQEQLDQLCERIEAVLRKYTADV